MFKDIRDGLFEEIYKIGKKDKNLIFISDDLDALILRKFRKEFPKQFINIGVAEQNMVDVAAGLSTCGKKVFVYGICTYITLRCLEQIKFSLCSMNLPVVIIGVGAGFSFSFDGSTHHGIQDIGVMRMMPELTIYNPPDAISAAASIRMSYRSTGPVYVRLDKGSLPYLYKSGDKFDLGYKVIKPIKDISIISTGYMSSVGKSLLDNLEKKGFNVGFVDLFRIKPVSEKFINVISKVKKLITIEENSSIGGLGSIVSEIITENSFKIFLKKFALPDKQFHEFGSRDYLHRLSGLDVETLTQESLKFLQD